MRGLRIALAVALPPLVGLACGDAFSTDEGDVGGSTGGSDPGSMSCAVNPDSCSADETCWIDAANTAHDCLPEGPGTLGDSCELVAGRADCAHGHFCFRVQSGPEPTCRQTCIKDDPAHDCPTGAQCVTLRYEFEPDIAVCIQIE